ncbi:MAG: phenylalanine--tRNA ligase subunit beta [Candidatus Wildermuthbacteria bacterium RIFCSPHIGHO2_02_FULL_47_12]|uniref:Phenylalanine--tRNA ligase beta subunit n=1 Tax=Candidatus Wildermuthbacteria bacterium RIFCSPHIGHO2_02_FULL_47_12 TaxID=1802451 RepID=A0A1G2R4I9_9BACT|nr:MAG: phenylalanine--tRNA ligase subunit beta [Candidatus Wildermuthbacteria bacterium RIFCSPHIGHO2_02_FULL_47_12]
MIFSYTWLQEFFTRKLPTPKALSELLAMHAFEVESVEKKGDDALLDVNILARRGDCLSHRGLAREIGAITASKVSPVQNSPVKIQKGDLPRLQVTVTSFDLVPRYSALVVEGAQIMKSPQWLKEKLEALGMNSINNVVDITNYVMLELGQPMHAFDYDKIKNHAMAVREAREGEKVLTLDDTTFSVPKGTLVIEDQKRLIDLMGIKGGKVSAIDSDTKNIIFQAAVFHPSRIYRTKKCLGYTTPAAETYIKGVDPAGTLHALERAASLLLKFGGGKTVQLVDIYPKKRATWKIRLALSDFSKILGCQIPFLKIRKILESLEFGVAKQGTDALEITVPTFRPDVALLEDVVEEVGRIYGYENIAGVFPVLPITPAQESENILVQDRVKDALQEAGCTEVYSYSFIGEKDLALFQYTAEEKAKLVELENPFSEDIKYLKPNGVDNLLKIAALNSKNYGKKDMKIFELGTEFSKTPKGVLEQEYIAGVIAPCAQSIQEAYAQAKGMVDLILERNGIAGVWYDDFQQSPETPAISAWDVAMSAEIKIGADEIGFINGAVSPRVLSALKIDRPVVAFEIDFAALFAHIIQETEYQPIPKFPAVFRDIAVVVPGGTKIGDILETIQIAGKELVRDVDLFDTYEQSFAFHIVYQAEDRTLTSKEVDALHARIIQALEAHEGWEVRK